MAPGRPADSPLRVDWIDARSPGGRLGLTILPGKHGPSSRYPGRVYRRDADADLQRLAELGVRRLLLLVEDHELRRWGDPQIVARAQRHGLEVLRHPIPDGGVPASVAEMDAMLAEIRDGLGAGNVAVACMGGIGRSGMVAACALVAGGESPSGAVARVRAARHPEAVETREQLRFVEDYARRTERRG